MLKKYLWYNSGMLLLPTHAMFLCVCTFYFKVHLPLGVYEYWKQYRMSNSIKTKVKDAFVKHGETGGRTSWRTEVGSTVCFRRFQINKMTT